MHTFKPKQQTHRHKTHGTVRHTEIHLKKHTLWPKMTKKIMM